MTDPMTVLNDNPRLRKTATLAVFLLLEAITVGVRLVHDDKQPINTISVSGEGKATAVPDVARITFSVMDTEKSVADAQTKATKQSNDAIAAVKAFGIKDADVKTISYSVSPQYNYNAVACPPGMACPSGAPTISGYQVSQTVEVKVRDTAKAGDVLQKLGALGVQNISGPDFSVDNPDSVKADARAEAITKARAQAQILAKQLGVHLGKVMSFSEGGTQPYPMYDSAGSGNVMYKTAAAVAPSPSLPTGQNEYDETVSVTYEIW
jgi:uncharacterized protein YggE